MLSVHWRWKLWESWSGGNEDGDELKIPGSITHTMVNPSACSGGFSFGLTVPAAEALYDIKNSVGNAREAPKSVLVARKNALLRFLKLQPTRESTDTTLHSLNLDTGNEISYYITIMVVLF